MKPSGGRLMELEKAKPGNVGDWIKSKMQRHILVLL